tara:strand:- start:92 stop:499 length:408 start_codon:yes stop_codon:yes gene_type:complete
LRKNIKILFFLLSSFIYAGDVSPVLGIRFSDILASNDLQDPTNSLGLKMEISEGVYSGFDVSNGDFRIFVQRNNMIFGMGNNNQNQPQFTVGGYYGALENLYVNLEYVINQLTDDGLGAGDPIPDQLRISLSVQF